MALVGVNTDSDPRQGWLDRRGPAQVGAEDAELSTIWTDLGATPMTYLIEPKTCTCPSGDGSLRWPYPVHPPEESQP